MNLMEFLERYGDKNLLNSAFCILHSAFFHILHFAFCILNTYLALRIDKLIIIC